jgi:hypothetical protein
MSEENIVSEPLLHELFPIPRECGHIGGDAIPVREVAYEALRHDLC